MKLVDSLVARIFKSKSNSSLDRCLERNSFDLNKTRLQTRRCSLENCSHYKPEYEHEEVHSVAPREDSIKLAKLRLSHDDHANSFAGQHSLDWEGQAQDQANHVVQWANNVSYCGSPASKYE